MEVSYLSKIGEYPKKSWLNPKVELNSSKIHGRGMFAKYTINKNEIVMIWGGEYFNKRSIESKEKRKISNALG